MLTLTLIVYGPRGGVYLLDLFGMCGELAEAGKETRTGQAEPGEDTGI